MRTRSVAVDRVQRGWRCQIYFTHTTGNQFTDEMHAVSSVHNWWLVAVLKAYSAARRYARANAPRPGEREAKGWD